MTDIIAIIPARFASKRFPGKVLADIGGKPLIQHVCERVEQARRVSRTVVATDDERIAEVVRSFGGEAVMTAPDHASGTDRVAEASGITGGDVIVNVQGDEPLIDPGVIDAVVTKLIADKEIVCATAAFETVDEAVWHDPNAVKVVMDQAGRALYFSRSPLPYDRDGDFGGAFVHIGIYCFRRAFLDTYQALSQTPMEARERLEQLRMLEHGYRIGVAVTSHRAIGVDTPEDLATVRKLMGE